MSLKEDIDQLAEDSDLVHQWVHGSDTDTITNEWGVVKSIAKATKDAQDAVASGAFAQVSATGGAAPATGTSLVKMWLSGGPRITWVDSSRSANGRFVDMLWSSGTFKLQFMNDAFNAAAAVLTASGTSAGVTTVAIGGRLLFGGATDDGSSVLQSAVANDGVAAAWSSPSGNLQVYPYSTSGNTGAYIISRNPSGGYRNLTHVGTVHYWGDGTSGLATLDATGLALAGVISTVSPAGGAGPLWKLGAASATTITTPNKSVRIAIAGTDYYLPAKLTND